MASQAASSVALAGSLREAFATTIFIKGWIEGAGARSHPAFKAIPSPDMPDAYPIIPLFGTAKAEVVLPAWPRISQVWFEILQTRIAARFDAVALDCWRLTLSVFWEFC